METLSISISLTDNENVLQITRVILGEIEAIKAEEKSEIDNNEIILERLKSLSSVRSFSPISETTIIETDKEADMCSKSMVFIPTGRTELNFPFTRESCLPPLTDIDIASYSEIPKNRRQRRLEAKKFNK